MKLLSALLLLTATVGPQALPAATSASTEAPRPPLTATHTIVNPAYVRTKLPDGSYRPETYAFGQGEFHSGRVQDVSIDALRFEQIAGILKAPLAAQGYVTGQDGAHTQLLIVVHWGTTIPFDNGIYKSGLQNLAGAMAPRFQAAPANGMDQLPGQTSDGALQASLNGAQDGEVTSMLIMQDQFNRMRDQANAKNAAMLGYAPEMARFADLPPNFRTLRDDLVDEIEDDRYFVVLAAFDFQELRKTKEKKILWITRFSIRAHGHRFDRDLAAMARVASSNFGRATKSLVRTDRVERFEIGEPEFIRYEDKK